MLQAKDVPSLNGVETKMSGLDEKPQKVLEESSSDFPRCSHCNCSAWIRGRAGYEYTLMEEEDPGEIYKWIGDEFGYTGETTTWSCQDCSRVANEAQLILLETHYADAEWL